MFNWMKGGYRKMRISCGKKHGYLGMDLGYYIPVEVKITMVPYLKKVIK